MLGHQRGFCCANQEAILDYQKQRAKKLTLTGLALALTGMSLSLGIYVEQPGRSINAAVAGAAVAAILIALLVNVWRSDG
jgi:hypothetical protein